MIVKGLAITVYLNTSFTKADVLTITSHRYDMLLTNIWWNSTFTWTYYLGWI